MKVAIVASMSLWWVRRLIPETQEYLEGVLWKISEIPKYLMPRVLGVSRYLVGFSLFCSNLNTPSRQWSENTWTKMGEAFAKSWAHSRDLADPP